MKLGFTIVELIIAVSIGMLMTGMGVVSLNNFNAKQELKSTRSELIALLRQARNYAKTQQIPDGFDVDSRGYSGVLLAVDLNNKIFISMSVACFPSCNQMFVDNKDIA